MVKNRPYITCYDCGWAHAGLERISVVAVLADEVIGTCHTCGNRLHLPLPENVIFLDAETPRPAPLTALRAQEKLNRARKSKLERERRIHNEKARQAIKDKRD